MHIYIYIYIYNTYMLDLRLDLRAVSQTSKMLVHRLVTSTSCYFGLLACLSAVALMLTILNTLPGILPLEILQEYVYP